ncbi:chromosome partitioning protein ParB, partial [Lachnospiraceae bacterium]|nr:chromosome partitioning protein ParB [Lachnospiraceae bacterium]
DTVFRYIRLTNLIPELLQKVDEGIIAFSPAVELSYLSEGQQRVLLDAMALNDCTPSHTQSIRLKRKAQQGVLSSDSIYEILSEEKANQQERISFRVEDLRSFFPKNYTQKQMTDTILKLLYDNQRKLERRRSSRGER